MVGTAIGPLLGGFLLEHFWWGSVFLLNVPVMSLLLLLGPFLLPEFKDSNAGQLDVTSAALSLIAMLSVIYGVKQLAQDGFGTVPLVAIVAGVAIGYAFIVRQKTLTDPLIDLRLFSVPSFSTSICTQLVTLLAMAGIYLFVAQYLQLVLGLSPLKAGLWYLPSTAAGMLASFLTPAISRRLRPAYLMCGGLSLAAIGMALLIRVGGGGGLGIVITSFVIMSIGINPTLTMTTDLIMGVAPPDRAGAASAISETSCELGLALGMAVLGSVGIAWYRSVMAADTLGGIPREAADVARGTLGGAVGVAERTGGEIGVSLLAIARDAFSSSLAIVAGIGAAIVMMTAIFVFARLRNIPIHSEATPEIAVPAAA